MAAGLAVSAFQDAAEYALVAVAHRLSISLESGFESLWRSIDNKGGPAGALPRKASMQALNKARVSFKHYGTLPDAEQVQEFRADVHLFLREVSRQFFNGLDFDSLNELELLEEGDIKKLLGRASTELDAGNIARALELCADARELLRKAEEPLYQTGLMVQFNNVPAETRREILLQTSNLREQLWRVRELVLASYFGVNLLELRLLQETIPKQTGGTYEWPSGGPKHVTVDTARRAIALLTRYAINVSRMWSATYRPGWQ